MTVLSTGETKKEKNPLSPRAHTLQQGKPCKQLYTNRIYTNYIRDYQEKKGSSIKRDVERFSGEGKIKRSR